MSIYREHTQATLSDAWRTINIDALEEDSPFNFDTSTLHPPLPEISEAEVRQLSGQVRQLMRGGDSEGALRGCLEMPVYTGSEGAKVRFADLRSSYSPRSPLQALVACWAHVVAGEKNFDVQICTKTATRHVLRG